MAIVEHSSTIRPTKIASCKRTYIAAKGVAVSIAKTSAAAAREAKDRAKRERENAAADARALICPQNCGRGRVCRDGGTSRTGYSFDWTIPVRLGENRWRCKAWASYSLYRKCRCA